MDQPQCPKWRERDARIAALEARLAEVEGRLPDLTKPPVPLRAAAALPKGPPKKRNGKKPGGQPSHPPHRKILLPAERVKDTVTIVPKECEHCHQPLPREAGPDDPPPVRHQVAELPKLAVEITEYQGHARTCPCCGKVTRARIPDAMPDHSVGPSFSACPCLLSYKIWPAREKEMFVKPFEQSRATASSGINVAADGSNWLMRNILQWDQVARFITKPSCLKW